MAEQSMLAFEIGTEEIPAFDLHAATLQLKELAHAALTDLRIPFEQVDVYSTPRRLIVLASGLAQQTEGLVEEHKGPSEKIAFDSDGNHTKAALGFARGKGVDVADLTLRCVDGVNYLYAVKEIPARPVKDLLPGMLESLITNLSWPKSCRWGSQSVYFSRPVRWLLALLDEEIIPVRFADLESSRATAGHRVLSPGFHQVERAQDLLTVLRECRIVPCEEEREALIRDGVARIEEETSARADLPQKTLLEVINLCECPTVMMGSFDEEFLKVPEEIIVDAMLMHQRYFPLYDANNKLTNNFIVVSNGDPRYEQTIIDGNERVVRARLSDAKFFYEEDLKRGLESYVEKLDTVVFQEKLGTVRAKTERIEALVAALADALELPCDERADAVRAAHLCKADLVTNAVVEFTSVQGIMGSYYAAASGESDQVAAAIADHYRPRFAGDEAPASRVGKLVAIADKLDTICGLFAVNQSPSGSSDPFALRRNAIGIIAMINAELPIKLVPAIYSALNLYSSIDFDVEAVAEEIIEFFVVRTKVILRDAGISVDLVDAVLAVGVNEPAEIAARAYALNAARNEMPEVMTDLATAYARAYNLADASLGTQVDPSLLSAPERDLHEAILEIDPQVEALLEAQAYEEAFEKLALLRQPIDTFFDEVKVMDEDEALKTNRLRLLNAFVEVFVHAADFGKLAK